MTDDLERRVIALESKVEELEALANLALKLLAVDRPVSALLEQFGATETEEHAVCALLDDVARRAEQGGMYSPSLSSFQKELVTRFPVVRGNREFLPLLLETLKLDRPAYRRLYEYAAAHGWRSKEGEASPTP